MPLKNKTFLSNICLYTFLILWRWLYGRGRYGEHRKYRSPHPLTISATVSRYTAIDKKYLRHPHANRERLYHRIFRW